MYPFCHALQKGFQLNSELVFSSADEIIHSPIQISPGGEDTTVSPEK